MAPTAPVVAAPAAAESAPAPLTQSGIALFYGGMVRRKSVLNVTACVVAICAVVSLLWFLVAYSIAFTLGSGSLGHFIGGTERLWFAGHDYVKDTRKVAVSGVVGSLITGVFASKAISGSESSLLMTAFVLWITSLFVSHRVGETLENDGLDISQYAERMGD